jgi:hypothetical protein
MQVVVRKCVIVATVIMAAAVSANCGGDSLTDRSAAAPLSPSALAEGLNAKGGGGGKGGGGTTGAGGSLTVKMVTDNNGDGAPNWGDTVTFVISTTATTQPNVGLTCSQNGRVVYSASAGFYDGYPWPGTQLMTLRSQSWQGGEANCTARLYYFSGTNTVNLSSINFTAGA